MVSYVWYGREGSLLHSYSKGSQVHGLCRDMDGVDDDDGDDGDGDDDGRLQPTANEQRYLCCE